MKLKIVDILLTSHDFTTADTGDLPFGPWEEVKVVVGNVNTGQATTVSNADYGAWYEPVEKWEPSDWKAFDDWFSLQEFEEGSDMGGVFLKAVDTFNELDKEAESDVV